MSLALNKPKLDNLTGDIWKSAERLRGKFKAYEYQGVILPIAVTTFEACFPDSIVGFVPDHRLNRDYLFYLLVAMKPALLRAMVVTTQPNINYVQIGGNYIPLPPFREQESIAEHIEHQIREIRDIQKSLNQQIATLTAYHKSLIHECVTGQRRVTEADVARSRLSQDTRQLNSEPSEGIGRLETKSADARQHFTDRPSRRL